jgi:7-dehydrocholesterol reductase
MKTPAAADSTTGAGGTLADNMTRMNGSATGNAPSQMTSDKTRAISNIQNEAEQSEHGKCGRETKASLGSSIGAFVAIFGCPLWVTINWIALEKSHGSLFNAFGTVLFEFYKGDISTFLTLLPKPSWNGTFIYAGWLVYQAVLFHILPGRTCYGQQTPGGHILSYKINGLTAWVITHLLFLIGVHQGWIEASVIARNWQGLFVAANVYGYLLAGFVRIKAYYMPSFPADSKWSGE